jgi:hypothetical protein
MEIIQDECSLNASLGTTWAGTLQLAGDRVWFRITDDNLFRLQFVGGYLANVEQFRLDGSAGNVTATARGRECLLDLVQAHLDGTTESAVQFRGTAKVVYEAFNPLCVCQLWVQYQARRQ